MVPKTTAGRTVPDAATWTGLIAPVSTLVGVFGGYWFAGRNDEKRDERAARRELEARRDGRAERLDDERHEVQRKTLSDLQDELQKLLDSYLHTSLDLYSRVILHEAKEPRTTPPPEVEYGQTLRTVERLESRILDPQLRAAVASFRECCDPYWMIDLPADEVKTESADRNIEAGFKYLDVIEQLGEHLRRELDG